MAREYGVLYFAPGIPFSEVDLTGAYLAGQFHHRIEGFYLGPARELAQMHHAFASGLMVICAADALQGFMTGASGTPARIKGFFQQISGLDNPEIAKIFCEDFRNGLVHEARVKNGSEFSLDHEDVARHLDGGRLSVNPLRLAYGVRMILDRYCAQLESQPLDKRALAIYVRRKFAYELAHCG